MPVASNIQLLIPCLPSLGTNALESFPAPGIYDDDRGTLTGTMLHMTPDDTTNIEDDDAAIDPHEDENDDAVVAADDTGMLSGERLITIAELQQGDSGAGGV
jgi:hypothetical protein